MPLLCAVEGDPNTHGGGGLIAGNPGTVFIEGKKAIEDSDPAYPDARCPSIPHCNPASINGSPTVFVYGKSIHRQNDSRICGAKTIVSGQGSVFAN